MKSKGSGSVLPPRAGVAPLRLCFIAILALAPCISHGGLPEAWKNVQPIEIEQAGLIKFSLPIDTIDGACPKLEDLRLHDASGQEVPYLLERPVQGTKVVKPARDVITTVRQEATAVELTVGPPGLSPAGVTLETPSRDFIKAVQVEGSLDRENWVVLARGVQIFRLPSGAEKSYIEIPGGPWSYLRMILDDRRSPPIPVTGVLQHVTGIDPGPSERLPVAIVERTESPHESRLTLQLAGSHVTIAKLTLVTPDPLFTRQVTLSFREYREDSVRENALAQDTIYRVAVDGQPDVSNLSFAIDSVLPSRELLLTIHNGDSPPLRVTTIEALRRPVYVTFLARHPGEYHLLSGNPHASAARYDLSSQRERLAKADVVPVKVKPIAPNPGYRPTDLVPDIQVGNALDTANWKYRKRLNLSQKGVQRLDLEPEVLSHADPTLRDLRLILGGRQLPFLVDSTSSSHVLTPDVSRADDPKKPQVSRWAILLPWTSLPIVKLTAESHAPYFKRDVRLYEEAADERGVVRQRLLSQSRWSRNLNEKEAQLVLSLSARPTGERLLLEIENGDNPPLEVESFQVWYAGTRLLFKAPDSGAEIFLYYGNPKADGLKYDLDLIASQLLAAEKGEVAVGPEEVLRKSSWTDAGRISGSAGVIFWIALVLVVAALLFIIARLLPAGKSGT
jgi:hypothetical protein